MIPNYFKRLEEDKNKIEKLLLTYNKLTISSIYLRSDIPKHRIRKLLKKLNEENKIVLVMIGKQWFAKGVK